MRIYEKALEALNMLMRDGVTLSEAFGQIAKAYQIDAKQLESLYHS